MSRLFKEILFSVCCSVVAFAAAAFYFWGRDFDFIVVVSGVSSVFLVPVGVGFANHRTPVTRFLWGWLLSTVLSGATYLLGLRLVANMCEMWFLMPWLIVMIAAAIGGFRMFAKGEGK